MSDGDGGLTGGDVHVTKSSAGRDLIVDASTHVDWSTTIVQAVVSPADVVFLVRVGEPPLVVAGFTGRDDVLQQLTDTLATGSLALVTQGLVGSGGARRGVGPRRAQRGSGGASPWMSRGAESRRS